MTTTPIRICTAPPDLDDLWARAIRDDAWQTIVPSEIRHLIGYSKGLQQLLRADVEKQEGRETTDLPVPEETASCDDNGGPRLKNDIVLGNLTVSTIQTKERGWATSVKHKSAPKHMGYVEVSNHGLSVHEATVIHRIIAKALEVAVKVLNEAGGLT